MDGAVEKILQHYETASVPNCLFPDIEHQDAAEQHITSDLVGMFVQVASAQEAPDDHEQFRVSRIYLPTECVIDNKPSM